MICYYKVYMRRTMINNIGHRQRGTRILGKVLKVNEAPPMKLDHLKVEFKKTKPTSFDKESNAGEEVEEWLLEIKKYLEIYSYSNNMKV